VEPYADSDSHVLMTSYLSPIRQNGRFIGLAGVDKALTSLSSDLSSRKALDGHGYLMAVSAKGALLAAPKKDIAGTKTLTRLAGADHLPALARIQKAVAAGRAGRVATRDPFTGKPALLAWAPVPSTHWAVIGSAPTSVVQAQTHSLRLKILIVGLLALAASAAASPASPPRPATGAAATCARGSRSRARTSLASSGRRSTRWPRTSKRWPAG